MGYWFRPKHYGYGASPANWRGWLAMAVFLALIFAVNQLTGNSLIRFGAFGVLLALFVWIVWKKTDGTWRWRWGSREKEK